MTFSIRIGLGGAVLCLAATQMFGVQFVSAGSKSATELAAALAARPDPVSGAKSFETCAACHGSDGAGERGGAVPAIAGQHFRVVVKQLVDFRHDRRWDVRMEHFADQHHLKGAQDIADVAAYVSELPRVWPVMTGTGEFLRRGASVYLARCAGCHGTSGAGNDTTRMPRVAGQHQAYLVRQLQDAADGRRPNMSGSHAAMVRSMSFAEIQGVADYLARIQPRQ
jgi:cytochrome c553